MESIPITDLVQIKKSSLEREDENLRFRVWMKGHDYGDDAWRAEAEKIQSAIDCRQCANCCRVMKTSLHDGDLERLAEALQITPDEVLEQYTEKGDSDLSFLKMTGSGCVFLDGNDCKIYENRPTECRGFPYLVGTEGTLAERTFAILQNAELCPIVYNSLERWKEMSNWSRFPPRRRRRRW
ncbi:MAG: YkgJ family cysteine cluster protein [Candidatus Solibacter usitatus]|nr:YkgJ family cysteine cluster protein [Candidatus Solibacter usitatus]